MRGETRAFEEFQGTDILKQVLGSLENESTHLLEAYIYCNCGVFSASVSIIHIYVFAKIECF